MHSFIVEEVWDQTRPHPGFLSINVGISTAHAVMVQPGLPLAPLLTPNLALAQSSCRHCIELSPSLSLRVTWLVLGPQAPHAFPRSLWLPVLPDPGKHTCLLSESSPCKAGTFEQTQGLTCLWIGLGALLLSPGTHSDLLSTLWGATSVHLGQLQKILETGYFAPEASS